MSLSAHESLSRRVLPRAGTSDHWWNDSRTARIAIAALLSGGGNSTSLGALVAPSGATKLNEREQSSSTRARSGVRLLSFASLKVCFAVRNCSSVSQSHCDQKRGFYYCRKRWLSWFVRAFFGRIQWRFAGGVECGAGFGVIRAGGYGFGQLRGVLRS